MIKTISGDSLDQLLIKSSQALLQDGVESDSRNGKVKRIDGVTVLELTNPLNRHVTLPERKWNPLIPYAESRWILAGSNNLNEGPGRYVKSLYDFSDDGKTWRAGYGPRLRRFGSRKIDQLRFIIETLKKDPNSRQAYITIGSPEEDCFSETGNLLQTKDMPCTRGIQLQMSADGRLDCYVTMRSNDCFTYETKIPLLNGEEWEIGRLAEEKANETFWVYSRNSEGKIVPGLAHHPRKTKKVSKIVRIVLDNGEKISCTPEHLFLLKDGSYKEAQKLTQEDSLSPLYRKLDSKGYEMTNVNGDWCLTHRIMNLDKGENGSKVMSDPLKKAKIIESLTKYLNSEIGKSKSRKTCIERNNKNWKDPKFRESMSKQFSEISKRNWENSEFRKRKSESSKKQYEDLEYRERNSQHLKFQAKKHWEEHREEMIKARRTTKKNQIRKILNSILTSNELICEENYEKHRLNFSEKYPKFSRLVEIFGSIDEAKAELIQNHRISSIKFLEEEVDVYDMTVDEHHNFALSAGVFVHNCIWGFSAVNVFNFTFMQQYVADILDVPMGAYYHVAHNLHVYEKHFELIETLSAKEIPSVNLDDHQAFYKKIESLEELDKIEKMVREVEDYLLSPKPIHFGIALLNTIKGTLFEDMLFVFQEKSGNREFGFEAIHPELRKIYDRK